MRGHLRAKTYSINQFYSARKIRQKKYDLFHPTYFDPYFLKIIKKPFIVTIHDLIVFKFPDVLRKQQQMAEMEKIINKAERIIAISENTKRDTVEILKVDPKKIDVLPPGKSAQVFATIKADKDAIAGDYVTSMEARTPEKTSKAEFRVSLKTSMLWGWVGILIILVALGSVYYLFRKYGRR